jgi:hypothetical protein
MKYLKYNIDFVQAPLRDMQVKAEFAKAKFIKAEKTFL